MMGFDGTTVTPEIRTLIEDYHLGSILLTAKNLKCIAEPLLPSSRDTEMINRSCGANHSISPGLADHCSQCRPSIAVGHCS